MGSVKQITCEFCGTSVNIKEDDIQVVEIQYGDYIKIVVDSTNIQKISTNKE